MPMLHLPPAPRPRHDTVENPQYSGSAGENKAMGAELPGLQHRQLARTGAEWKSLIDPGDLGVSQPEVSGPCVFGGVFGLRRLGDREERGPPYQEPQRDLARSCAV